MKKEIFFSFIINIIGLLSLFLIDIYISKNGTHKLISSWAQLKSILFIGVMFVLLGLDQAIVRLKLKINVIFVYVIIQFFIIAFLIAFVLKYLYPNINFLIIFFSLFLLALIYVFFAENRLNMKFIKAQIFLHGWKIILLILFFVFKIEKFQLLLPISMAFVILILGYEKIKFIFIGSFFKEYKKALITGLHYFISMIALTLSLYMDQLLLNYDKRIEESSILFTYITFFISPAAILFGFSGFIYGSYIRNNPHLKTILFKRVIYIYIIIGILIILGSFIFGKILFELLKNNSPNFYLSITMGIIVFLRYLYILPSVYIGSFAKNKLIRHVSAINFIGILLYIAIYFLISRIFHNYLLAIVLSIIVVWTIRIGNGYYAIYKILKEDVDESI